MSARRRKSLFPDLGFGLGLRADHYSEILNGGASVDWFEAISENYMDDGGRPIQRLMQIRRDRPVALHGVSLSIGSVDPLDEDYLERLKKLIDQIQPALVSDHCCWTGFEGQNLHDLLPVPYTLEALRHISERILRVQDRIGRRILLENVSSYISFAHSEMDEWEFLSELVRRADCGLLLDVNNVYVSSVNHGFDPLEFLSGIPADRIGQIHLAGHSESVSKDGSRFLIDTHDTSVCPKVWMLYEQAIQLTGPVSTMVEWDTDIPRYEVLEAEVFKAKAIQEGLFERAQETIA